MNDDGTINDLLYDSPNYLTKNDGKNKFYVANIVKLEKLLQHYQISEHLYNKDIRYICNFFISKNALFFLDDHNNLPISVHEYENLEQISVLKKKPQKVEKKEVEKFKKKIKTYTFR